MAKFGIRRGMFQPLNCMYLILTLLLCVMMEALVFERGYNKMRAEAEAAINEQTNMAAEQFADIVTATRDAYVMHSMDEEMNKILSEIDSPYTLEYIVESQYLKNALYYLISGNELFADVGFVRRGGSVITYNSLSNQDKLVLRQTTETYPLGTDYVLSQVYDNKSLLNSQQRFLVVREMFQNTQRESIGFMAFFIDVDGIRQSLEEHVRHMEQAGGVLLMEGDTLVCGGDRNGALPDAKALAQAARQADETAESGIVHLQEKRYGYVLREEPYTGWTVLGYYDADALVSQCLRDNALLHIAIFAAFVLIIIIELRSFRFLNRTVRALKDAMAQAEQGRFVQLDGLVEKNPELHTVVSGFNRMSASLQQLVYDNYVARLQRKEAELKMLRLQINPHFLYNTLNLIHSLAVLGENDKVARMTENMGQMFRYNMAGSSGGVHLRDEIDLLRRYCEIQQVRFPGKLRIEWDVEEELLDCSIEKYTLQPLVENIFKHNRLHDPIRIRISARPGPAGELVLEVWNSGPGIEPERLAAVQKELAEGSAREKETSIGLLNVNERIRMACGPDYGVQLFSEPGQGVLVRVTIPCQHKTQEEAEHERSDS